MRRSILAALLAVLALPAAANAAFFPSEVIDGPADIVGVGDVDLARDGQGGVVYVKKDAGVEHVFLSLFSDGVFQPPVRADQGMATASSQPVIGVSDHGRAAIAFISGDMLFTAAKARDASAFSAPAPLAQGGVSNPSLDMSVNGVSYVSWTQNGDVKVARAERDSPTFTTLPAPVDVEPAQEAGSGERRRSRVAVSADGSALVVWGENGADGRGHVFARRLFELRLSTAPQDLTLSTLEGQPAQDADTPEVDIEDDSSFAQVVFRQQTAAGPRVVMRRLRGSQFEDPIVIDSGVRSSAGRIDLQGRGEGLLGVSGAGNEAVGGVLWNNALQVGGQLSPAGGVDPRVTPALGENEDGALIWMVGSGAADASVRGRFYDNIEKPLIEPDAVLARPELGAVVPSAGLDAAPSRAGDVVSVFVQAGADGRRLVAGIYDKVPSRVGGYTTTKKRRLEKLRWSPAINLLGPVTYRILVDGRPIGEVQQPELVIQPGMIRDGSHRWQIVEIDRRGQQQVSRTRPLRVDNTPPRLRVRFIRSGRSVTVLARASDRRGRRPAGLDRLMVDWGNGYVKIRRRASHTYARGGRHRVRVKAVDKALNETVVTRRFG